MPPPVYSALDYAIQFQRLLPRGRVWHRGLPLVQDADLTTLMPTWSRLHARLNDLIDEIFPCTTYELLPEWEATLGLPDPCIGPLDTVQQRVAAVCAKFVARGGCSLAYFHDLIETLLGYDVEIVQFSPFRVGIDTVGEPLRGEAWAYAWMIIVPVEADVTYFRTGLSTAGEPLATWGDKRLECLIAALKPGHTIPIIAYQPPEGAAQ
jgi:uncharacterized protein YmfQ (DUF2313 family)